MDTRKLSVIHSHLVKPSKHFSEPIEIPVSPNSKVLGVTVDPFHYWPVIAIEEDAQEENKETHNRVFHLRPDGTPFKDAHRFQHIGSVYVMMFQPALELIHVFEERVALAMEEGSVIEEGDTVYLKPEYWRSVLYGFMRGAKVVTLNKSSYAHWTVQVDGKITDVIAEKLLTKKEPKGWKQ